MVWGDKKIARGMSATFRKGSGGSVPKTRKIKKVVSMFSGCGGMDLGFIGSFRFNGRKYDRLPFEIVWANDMDESACETYRKNLGHDIHCGDINTLLDTLPKRADVLIGGFPCQDVSINGTKTAERGARSTLFRAMQEAIRRVNPRIFIAENVKGILMSHSQALYSEMMQGFDMLGYKMNAQVYLAADYGVPQMRERVLFVGTRKSAPVFNHPLPVLQQNNWVSALSAIDDLSNMEIDKKMSHIWSAAKPSPEQGRRKLVADRPSSTIRAESHGNNQFHYALPRRISLREAARLQSFPDDFTFVHGMRRTERQIGNAVPPVLAWHVAYAVQQYLA